MEGKLRIIILVLVILVVISLFLIFTTRNSKLALLREYNSTKQRLTKENEELTKKLNSLLEENESLQDRLEVIQGDLERISSERDQIQDSYKLVNKEREELLERLESYAQLVEEQEDIELFKDENKTLKEKIDTLEKDNVKLKAELNEFRQDKESLKQKIEEAKRILKEKTRMARYMKEREPSVIKEQEPSVIQEAEVWSIDLPPIVVSPQVSLDEGLPSLLEGKILNVNTRYNFVVIDLGKQQGVKEGMVFEVFRGDKLLGKAEVIQLRKKIAACDIIQADMLFKIGDIVRY